jgi:hypothetical protein
MGATGLTAVLSRSTAHPGKAGVASHCAAPAPGEPLSAPSRLGSWPYSLIEPGQFASVAVDGPDDVLALQACGPEETMLRAVRVELTGTGGHILSAHIAATGGLERAALLTSSLAVGEHDVWLGLARLDLSGSAGAPPYELTLERLDPATLSVTWSTPLGRGFGLSLAAIGPTGAVASTGRQLLGIESTGGHISLRLLTSFSGVVQHIAVSSDGATAAVGVIQPGAIGAAAAPEIEAVNLQTGAVVANVALQTGSDPQSLAVSGATVWAAVGDGLETDVVRFALPTLRPLGTSSVGGNAGVPTTLETLGLDPGSGVIWVRGLTVLDCAGVTTGRVIAATSPTGSPPPYVSQIVPGLAGETVLAVTAAGLGRLEVPTVCTG